MSLEIEDAFKAKAQSASSFLSMNGQGCYIPAYQRYYSWDEENVSRLLEDSIQGLQLLLKREKTISFLGSIIAIHDTTYRTVQPIFKSEVPSRVTTIIDGQQRLCTLVMANIVLHDLTRRLMQEFSSQPDDYAKWIYEQCEQLLSELFDTFILDLRSGDSVFRCYPRIIRAYDDVWSKRSSQAVYQSPISGIIWSYYVYQAGGALGEFTLAVQDSLEGTNLASLAFRFLQKHISQLTGTRHKENDFVDLSLAMSSPSFMKGIWGYGHEVPSSLKGFLGSESNDAAQSRFCQLLRIVVLAKYLNHRTAFTVVTTDNEDDAFDMFEALNTTGEPLTAFETFKPKIIESEGLENYRSSQSFILIGQIERYLNQFTDARKKEDGTAALLLPFALAETGEKLPKKLRDQRRYLRDQYESDAMRSLEAKHCFLRRLSHFANFLSDHWQAQIEDTHRFFANHDPSPEVLVGFRALQDLNHSIVIAPLVRYFAAAVESNEKKGDLRVNDFHDCLKAVIAFSLLWRGAHGGTGNIDSHYRALMRDGGFGVSPLSFRSLSGDPHKTLPIDDVRKYFRSILAKQKLDQKEAWVQAATAVPIYQHSRIVARYFLFLASDDAVDVSSTPGLVTRGRRGVSPLLRASQWNSVDFTTVEHIVPQSSTSDWVSSLYNEPGLIDSLGNLLLLPKDVNSLLGNRKWLHKKAILKVVSARDLDEFKSASDECVKFGLNLSKQGQQVLEQSRYLMLCRSLAAKSDEWTPEFVTLRGRCIAELVWDRLAPWLKFS